MKTGIVILAAGESSRMGEPKQLLQYRGRTLLQHTVDIAHSLSFAPVAVVLGAHAEKIYGQLDTARVIVTENPDWRDGMGGSFRMGLGSLLAAHGDISAVIIMLCDQPLVTPATLRELIAKHRESGRPIVASEYQGTLGVPALFARPMFAKLLALADGEGARKIIRSHREETASIAFPDGAFDVDTPADFARLRISFSETRTPATV